MLVHRSIPTGNVPNSAPMLMKGGGGEILIPQVLQQIKRGGRPFKLQPPPCGGVISMIATNRLNSRLRWPWASKQTGKILMS